MADRPNIVLIMTDQWRYNTLGRCDSHVKTPVLDQLADEGAYLSDAYCSSSVCSPARASWLTGLYPHGHTQLFNYNKGVWGRQLPASKLTLGDAFCRAGYRCGIVGAWHLGNDEQPQHGFEEYWLTHRCHSEPEKTDPYIKHLSQRNLLDAYRQDYEARRFKFTHGMATGVDPTGVCQLPVAHQRTTWTIDRSIDFLGDSASAEPPWFLFISIKDPHPPLVAPQEFVSLYDATDLPLPPNWDDDLADKPAFLGSSYQYSARRFGKHTMRRIAAHYYALCSHVDHQVGRFLAALDRTGQAPNTIVVFISDHGESLGEHGLYSKRTMYEGAVRVPWLVRWPQRIQAGLTIHTPVAGVDLVPTLLDLAGVPLPGPVHGRSLAGPLLSGGQPEAVPILAEMSTMLPQEGTDWLAATIMIRTGRWKYIRHRFDACEELYDLQDDPGEMHNLIHSSDHSQQVPALRAMIAEILKNQGPGLYAWATDS